MWVLLITLFSFQTGEPEVHQISGFTKHDLCINAATDYMNVNAEWLGVHKVSIHTQCVKVKEEK
jgi:hypothetical protein